MVVKYAEGNKVAINVGFYYMVGRCSLKPVFASTE
jgi:hypothetical protein